MRTIRSKTKIANIDWSKLAAPQEKSFLVSPDNRHVAAVIKTSEGVFVQLDSHSHPTFEVVRDLQFSPDSQHIAYLAFSGKHTYMVIDGESLGPYEGVILRSYEFSPDSQHFAFIARTSAGDGVVIDGHEHHSHQGILEYEHIFSPDGKQWAYGVYDDKAWSVVAGEKVEGSYRGIGRLVFCPNGTRLGYKAQIGDKEAAILDGAPQKLYDHADNPHFSRDGSLVAYAARDGKQWMAVVNGQEGARFDEVILTDGSVSLTGDRVAYVARQGKELFVVLDGEAQGPYPGVFPESITFSPDGACLAYIVSERKKGLFGLAEKREARMVVDGQASAVYVNLSPPCFSPDGSRYAHLGEREKKQKYLVVDGKELGPHEGDILASTQPFSPDSARLAYYVRSKRGLTLVIDDRQYGPFEAVGEGEFSPDSAHYVSGALVGDRQTVLLDGEEGKAFDVIVVQGGGKARFSSATEFHYLVVEGQDYYLIEEVIS